MKKPLFILLLVPMLCVGTQFLALLSCADKDADQPAEAILARIGDRTISVDEFMRRAEYTIRPAYCRGDNYIHRKIVLNSLIAEKLLALEAEADLAFLENEEFQDYLAGRKEQAMRQWHYYKEAFEKAGIDTNEIKTLYSVAGRVYKIAYLTLEDSARVAGTRQRLASPGASFERVCQEISGALTAPRREVAFNSAEHENILDALFSRKLEKNQIIGPIAGDDNQNTFIKILGWTDRKLLSQKDMLQRWQDAKAWLRDRKAGAAYDACLSDLMRGKKLEFMPRTFRRLVNLIGPYYLRSEKEKKAAFDTHFWSEDQNEISLAGLGNEIDNLGAAPLFRIDDQIWTMSDFEKEMRRHPLVFRKRRFSQAEFAGQFRLAIVDMVRDSYITKDAYEKGYDKVAIVQRNYGMWRDNLYALYQQNKYLSAIGKIADYKKDVLSVIKTDLNPLIDSLQAKYDAIIEIDTERFEQIQLSRIDMMALQRNLPFPIIVPNFPALTSDHRLDYGHKMRLY